MFGLGQTAGCRDLPHIVIIVDVYVLRRHARHLECGICGGKKREIKTKGGARSWGFEVWLNVRQGERYGSGLMRLRFWRKSCTASVQLPENRVCKIGKAG